MYNCNVLKILTCNPGKFRSFSQAITYQKRIPPIVKVKKWKQNDVIKYLRSIKNELDLKDKYIDIIEEQEIVGPELLKLTEKQLETLGMSFGPAMRIVDHAQKLKTVEIEDNDTNLQRCLDCIKIMIDNMGPLVGRKEAIHSRYIDIILQNSLHIAKQITEKQISLDPEFDIIDVEVSGDIDYAFRMSTGKINSVSEELVCITEGKRFIEDIGIIQNIVQLESAFCSNKKQKNGDTGENFKDYYDYLYAIFTAAMYYTPKGIYLSESYLINSDEIGFAQ
ncbi:crinkler family protein [Gigaspora margarita]|uniref:Crinkler family protein n=1 Tax=Gigaspora margarita TaxID=4874 RepID=A0A8H4B5A4_GIGMA|nr:crinkler family protein [Gigaspora margarita]